MQKDFALATFLKGLFCLCFVGMFFWILGVHNVVFWLTVAAAGVLLAVSYGLDLPHFGKLLFVVALLLRVAAVWTLQSPILSDFQTQLQASEQFAAGDMSFQDTSYFQSWGYQTGLVIYQGLLLKIWDNVLILKLANCLWGAATVWLIYAIAREFFQERACRCAALCYTCFLFPLTFTAIPNNSIPSGFFLYLCLYFLVKEDFLKEHPLGRYALASLSLALSNFFRPGTIVMLVAVAAYFLFEMVFQWEKRNLLHWGKCLAVFFFGYFLLTNLFSQAVILTGINSAGLKNNEPLWSVLVGLNYDSGGTYNPEWDAIYQRMEEQGCTYEQAQWSLILDRISIPPDKLSELACSKIHTFWWGNPMGTTLGYLEPSPLYDTAVSIHHCSNWLSILLCAGGSVVLFKSRRRNAKAYLVPFLIFAVFCAYLVVEVQSRYAYVVQPAVFILSAGGFQLLAGAFRLQKGIQACSLPKEGANGQ